MSSEEQKTCTTLIQNMFSNTAFPTENKEPTMTPFEPNQNSPFLQDEARNQRLLARNQKKMGFEPNPNCPFKKALSRRLRKGRRGSWLAMLPGVTMVRPKTPTSITSPTPSN